MKQAQSGSVYSIVSSDLGIMRVKGWAEGVIFNTQPTAEVDHVKAKYKSKSNSLLMPHVTLRLRRTVSK